MYEIALANSYFEPQSPHEGSLISSSSMFLQSAILWLPSGII